QFVIAQLGTAQIEFLVYRFAIAQECAYRRAELGEQGFQLFFGWMILQIEADRGFDADFLQQRKRLARLAATWIVIEGDLCHKAQPRVSRNGRQAAWPPQRRHRNSRRTSFAAEIDKESDPACNGTDPPRF